MLIKLLFFSWSLFLFIGCGVKGDPVAPKGTQIPSYINQYAPPALMTTPKTQEEKEEESEKKGKSLGEKKYN